MKKIFFISALSWAGGAFAQNAVTGNIYIPPMQSVSVIQMDEKPVDFSTIQDYAGGKLINGYCRIIVKSNYPWKLSARINTDGMPGGANAIPENVISIQAAGAAQYTPLSAKPVSFLQSSNENISNEYTLNLRIDPRLELNAQVLLMNLSFIVTPL